MYRVLQATALMSFVGCFMISSAATCNADSTTIDWGVVKTIRPDYVLYEPPWWFSMTQPPPVIFYLHGLNGNDEEKYQKHLAELAMRRFAVVFLKWDHVDSRLYYGDLITRYMTAHQDLSNKTVGYWRTRESGRFAPDIRNYGIVGHSLGGMYALKLAADLGWYELAGFGFIFGVPKALVLQDAGGFGAIFPYVTPGGRSSLDPLSSLSFFYQEDFRVPIPNNPFWLDDLHSISPQTMLVMLLAGRTVDFQFNKISGPIDFGNATFSGVWTRAWHNTGLRNSRKHVFVVEDGGHWDVERGPALPYVNVTSNALNAALGRSTFSSEQPGVVNFRYFMDLLYPTPWTSRNSDDEKWWEMK